MFAIIIIISIMLFFLIMIVKEIYSWGSQDGYSRGYHQAKWEKEVLGRFLE
jgi:hypothetical protein